MDNSDFKKVCSVTTAHSVCLIVSWKYSSYLLTYFICVPLERLKGEF